MVLAGLAVVLRLIVTIYALQIAVDFVRNAFAPLIPLLQKLGIY